MQSKEEGGKYTTMFSRSCAGVWNTCGRFGVAAAVAAACDSSPSFLLLLLLLLWWWLNIESSPSMTFGFRRFKLRIAMASVAVRERK